MSFLSRLTDRHLDDAALAVIWTADASRSGAGGRPALEDPHLARCAECRVRFEGFAAWMSEVAADARLEADEAFPDERLAAQQAQILRRIEASEHPVRVIAFPRFHRGDVTRSVPRHRWIAVAAAAGLAVGVGLGQLMNLPDLGRDRQFPSDRAVQSASSDGRVVPANAPTSDEALLLELEAAATPRYEALRAFDTLTPRAADFLQSSR